MATKPHPEVVQQAEQATWSYSYPTPPGRAHRYEPQPCVQRAATMTRTYGEREHTTTHIDTAVLVREGDSVRHRDDDGVAVPGCSVRKVHTPGNGAVTLDVWDRDAKELIHGCNAYDMLVIGR